jgi:hypothetical protein
MARWTGATGAGAVGVLLRVRWAARSAHAHAMHVCVRAARSIRSAAMVRVIARAAVVAIVTIVAIIIALLAAATSAGGCRRKLHLLEGLPVSHRLDVQGAAVACNLSVVGCVAEVVALRVVRDALCAAAVGFAHRWQLARRRAKTSARAVSVHLLLRAWWAGSAHVDELSVQIGMRDHANVRSEEV